MKFLIQREELLQVLQLVVGVVERRQTLPILANVLLKIENGELCLIGTDLEIELQGRTKNIQQVMTEGAITVPARKLMDICRAVPENIELEISVKEQKMTIKAGRSRFSLTTLPASEFPNTETVNSQRQITLKQADFRSLLEQTHFAMAQQDVRYYLNGMLLEANNDQLVAVATDGHRLAFNSKQVSVAESMQIILPRKGVLELLRLLSDNEREIKIIFDNNHVLVSDDHFSFSSKLIDGRFPDYRKVIPKVSDKALIIQRDDLKQALMRVAVLANEKHRGLRFELKSSALHLQANNPEQEEAEEEISVNYGGTEIDIGFNVTYLLDAINALPSGEIKLGFTGPDSSVRIESLKDEHGIYVVMPMRL